MSQDKKQDPSGALELAHLYARAPIALCVTDREHCYVRINQRLCDINGKPMQEHVGRLVREVIPHLADQMNASDAVSGEGDPGMIVIRTSSSDGCVEVSITDNGPGFPDDISQDPFAPFISSKPEGLGLGLSISRTIIEAHGGQLLAESSADGGASLRIILPVSSGEEE